MLKYRKNKDDLKKYVHNHKTYFENIDTETYQASEVLLGTGNELKKMMNKNKKDGGEVNMCKALEDLYNEGVNEGKLLVEHSMQLISILLSEGKIAEVQRVAEDADYRQKLMNEMFGK
jgi:hypothetical protein